MNPDSLLRAVKAVVAASGFVYPGQGLLAVLCGSRREKNAAFPTYPIARSPVTRAARFVTPKWIPDRRTPVIAYGLLSRVWIILFIGRTNLMRSG